MIYITGDTHRDFYRLSNLGKKSKPYADYIRRCWDKLLS